MARVGVVGSYAPSLINFRGSMLQAFRRAGHDVLACAPEPSAEVRETLRDWGVEVESIPVQRQGVNPFADLRTLWSLYRRFSTWQPDCVFTYTAKPVVYGSLAAYAAGARPYAMMTGLGYAFTADTYQARWLRRFLKILYGPAYAVCDTVIFQNADDRARMKQEGVLRASTDTALVPGSGVDTSHFEPVELPERPVFLCMGRLLAEKGIREYVDAARRVKARYPDVEFRLAGWIEPSVPGGVTEDEVQRWDDEGIIDYLGYVDNVRTAFAETAVYVLPSYREGTPRSVLEAMAMGRPIITSDAPGCRETVVDGKNGLLVAPRMSGELAEAMEWMIKHRDQWSAMGRESRRMARSRFEVSLVNRSIMEIMNLIPDSELKEMSSPKAGGKKYGINLSMS